METVGAGRGGGGTGRRGREREEGGEVGGRGKAMGGGERWEKCSSLKYFVFYWMSVSHLDVVLYRNDLIVIRKHVVIF